MLLMRSSVSKHLTGLVLLTSAFATHAGYEIKLGDGNVIEFGGYLKADARYVSGTVPYRDYWIGSGATAIDSSEFRFSARETRFNTKYTHGDVVGFLEFDLYGGNSNVGNEVISNSYAPRLRHAFIKYEDWLIGQTWTTFMNTSAIPETADFGGPLVGEVFVRQGQLRYTNGGLQLAIENPENWGGENKNDKLPDFVGKYSFDGDWGGVSVAALIRKLDSVGVDEVTLGMSIAGKIKTFGKDDFRFQFSKGSLGRYVGVTVAKDVVGDQVEETTAYTFAYRHFWTEDIRSTVFYGKGEAELTNAARSHYGANIFTNLTKQLSVGLEYGNYDVSDLGKNGNSDYLQLSVKYGL
ncbi:MULTISPECIES: DcaP family trimeric outer membrane transporter [unclassified Shewanella]|uniref:DcaP family trimeric outer membrane transporter n=1 Tax=unclassified Shewanella TaxID=196818 RepID=UPI002DD67261|nr:MULTISPECIES: DcaP family trimeric outer membrane transporter [unclassified Shewanella]